jgi:hypothetical protein
VNHLRCRKTLLAGMICLGLVINFGLGAAGILNIGTETWSRAICGDSGKDETCFSNPRRNKKPCVSSSVSDEFGTNVLLGCCRLRDLAELRIGDDLVVGIGDDLRLSCRHEQEM